MLRRFLSFVFLQLAFGIAGWWAAGAVGALAGVVGASIALFLIDLLRGAKVLGWLRQGAWPNEAPALKGLWGEVADRTRRTLRARDENAQQAQSRLQEFLAAIQASPNGVVLLDREGRIEWCNETAAHQLGFDAQRDALQLVGNLVRDPEFAAYLAGGDYSEDVVIAGRDATPARPSRISVQLHPYGEGHKLLLTRDITALEQADSMRRDFVANVSHEIRTPLTVLNGFVETLQTLPLDEQERSRYLALMAQQAQRMQALVSDLLTLSRLEGSPPPSAGEWTPVRSLIAQCEQEAQALSVVLVGTLEAPQNLRFHGPFDGEIAGSPAELQSAMSNLVSNAVRYTPPGGTVDVEWKLLADGGAVFSVRDSGPGIAAEHIPRLTERFYRVDRSRSRETGGTGLGLAIVKHVLQRHGATLQVTSTLGQGSTFSIVFPPGRVRVVAERPRLRVVA